jgi:hypothetical protein
MNKAVIRPSVNMVRGLTILFAILFILELASAAFMPVFRCTVYNRLPVHPGDAYGIADLIEYVLAVTAFSLAAAVVVLGLGLSFLAEKKRRLLFAALTVLGLAAPACGLVAHQQILSSHLCRP